MLYMGCRILRVILVRRWQPGFWEFGGGRVGRGEKGEVSLQQPETEVDGSCHSKEGSK
jgi:hypothetical protein